MFKQGESHASRILPEPLASLREYSRLHLFFVEYTVALQNRMYNIRYQIHPEFDTLFSKPVLLTTLALMREELVHPLKLKACDLDTLTQVIQWASRGRLGQDLAHQLHQSAETSFAVPYAVDGFSFSLKLLAAAYQHTHRVILPALRERIETCLDQLPFNHHLDEIPFFGPIVIAVFLSELGLPTWFRSVDSVVAWFGFDPAVSESANWPTGTTHLTKRGTKYGRRMMWLVARNWALYTPQGRAVFNRARHKKKLSYDGTICVLAAKLIHIAFQNLSDSVVVLCQI